MTSILPLHDAKDQFLIPCSSSECVYFSLFLILISELIPGAKLNF